MDDVLDFVVAAVLVKLLGWHWELLPAFGAELVPGVDWAPFGTFAVMNVYRKIDRARDPLATTQQVGPAGVRAQ